MTVAARIGCVVIGRNEGDRIAVALRSVTMAGLRCVYVDSASSDNSVAIARQLADLVVQLDAGIPLSAARGRNEGFAALMEQWPDIAHVMFLDGDCRLFAEFPVTASAVMDARDAVAIVVGTLVEKAAAQNIYTRLASLEWFVEAGDMRDFGNLGGIMLARASHFRSAGGFDTHMIAGEDSELGVRQALAGRIVTKIDCPMAEHDACITSFGQWWRRSIRAGHALTQRYMKNGRSALHDCRRDFYRTLFWGLVIPLAAIVPAWWTLGFSLILLLGYPLSFAKVAVIRVRRGFSIADALLEARFSLYHKAANMIGLATYFRRRLTGDIKIIEYKRDTIREGLS